MGKMRERDTFAPPQAPCDPRASARWARLLGELENAFEGIAGQASKRALRATAEEEERRKQSLH